jgi:hypothetical protein
MSIRTTVVRSGIAAHEVAQNDIFSAKVAVTNVVEFNLAAFAIYLRVRFARFRIEKKYELAGAPRFFAVASVLCVSRLFWLL